MKKFLVGVVVMVVVMLSGCRSGGSGDGGGDGVVKVVTTIPPLYSLTAKLAEGSEVEVRNLVPPGSSVHSFQLKPSDAILLEDADLIVINGLDLEEFLADRLGDFGSKVVDTSEGIEAIAFLEGDGDEHGHGAFDPHVWLDPDNAVEQSKVILDGLKRVDEGETEIFEANFKKTEAEISELKGEIGERLGKLEKKDYILFHDAYAYFEKAFGLEHAAVLEEFPGTEPSPQFLSNIVKMIEEKKVSVIFTEPQFSPKLVKLLVDEYGVKALELDPLGTEVSADGYWVMMRKNVSAFEQGFTSQ